MKIEQWAVEKVIPYDRNPRFNDGAVEATAKSIEAFGFRQPIVVDKAGWCTTLGPAPATSATRSATHWKAGRPGWLPLTTPKA